MVLISVDRVIVLRFMLMVLCSGRCRLSSRGRVISELLVLVRLSSRLRMVLMFRDLKSSIFIVD